MMSSEVMALGLLPRSPPLIPDDDDHSASTSERRVHTLESIMWKDECVLGAGGPVWCIAFAPRRGGGTTRCAVLAAGVGSLETSRSKRAGELCNGSTMVQLWEIGMKVSRHVLSFIHAHVSEREFLLARLTNARLSRRRRRCLVVVDVCLSLRNHMFTIVCRYAKSVFDALHVRHRTSGRLDTSTLLAP